MTTLTNFLKLSWVRNAVKKSPLTFGFSRPARRNYGDSSKADSTSKLIVAQGTENEGRLRVRRARISDVPRVMRFVRENVRVAFPALASPPETSQLVLSDYVHRALAQGHSILAEQLENHRGWSQVRGLALSTVVCPWDAALLDRWACCVNCARSRRLMVYTAQCLRAPALHDKYKVHNILQVILIVPPNTSKASEIAHMLAKHSLQRGREGGFPLIRFDVGTDLVSKSLEGLQLRKECLLSYETPSNIIKEDDSTKTPRPDNQAMTQKNFMKSSEKKNVVAVYTAQIKTGKV